MSVILEFVNLLCAGLLAGGGHCLLRIAEPLLFWTNGRIFSFVRGAIWRLRVVVPAVYVPMALSGIAMTVMDGTGGGFGWRSAGLLAVLIWTLTTFLGTVPINAAMLAWRPDAPPAQLESNRQQMGASRYYSFLGGGHDICVLFGGGGAENQKEHVAFFSPRSRLKHCWTRAKA